MQASVIEWLDETERKYSGKSALINEEGSISYHEYKRKSLAIARAIIESYAGGGDRI